MTASPRSPSPLRARLFHVAAAVAYPVGGVLVVLAGVELWVRLGDVKPYVFVPVTDVVQTMVERYDFFFSASAVTLKEIALGLAASIAVAVPLAIAIDASRGFERRMNPLLLTSQVTPQIAYAPIIVIWFGFGLTPKVIIVTLFTFFPLVIDTVAGLRSTEVEKVHLARSMKAGRVSILFKIKLPTALPSMFAGLKVSATLAVIGAVIAEFIASSEGLGYVLLAASGGLDVATMLAAIGYLTLIGVGLFLLVDFIEGLALRWHVSRRSALAATL